MFNIGNVLPTSMCRTMNTVKLKTVKASPTIFMVAGVIGVAASAVLACRATLKLDEILEKREKEVNRFKDAAADEELSEYTEDNAKKDIRTTNIRTGLDLATLFAPAILLGGLSVTSIFWSNHILNVRNATLTAAYATLHDDYKAMLKRIDENLNTELANKIKYNEVTKDVDLVEEHEDGSAETKTEKVHECDRDANPYAFYFGPYIQTGKGDWIKNPNWYKNPANTLTWLRGREAYCNRVAHIKGRYFMNDALDELNLPRTKTGQIVGWILNNDDSAVDGDNYISFGINDLDALNIDPNLGIRLEFNVDGNVWATM